MEIGGRHIKRIQTEIEKEDRIIIKTEIVDESYEQNKNNLGNIIDYRDIDPGQFVVKEEPQNESVGFIAQIKTEDNLDIPLNSFELETLPRSSSCEAAKITCLKAERNSLCSTLESPPDVVNPIVSLDKNAQISLGESSPSATGDKIFHSIKQNIGVYGLNKKSFLRDYSNNSSNLDRENCNSVCPDKSASSHKGDIIVYNALCNVNENLRINNRVVKSEDSLDSSLDLKELSNCDPSNSDKAGASDILSEEHLKYNNIRVETQIGVKENVIVKQCGEDHWSEPCSSVKAEDNFAILEELVERCRTSARTRENETVDLAGNDCCDSSAPSNAGFNFFLNNKLFTVSNHRPGISKLSLNEQEISSKCVENHSNYPKNGDKVILSGAFYGELLNKTTDQNSDTIKPVETGVSSDPGKNASSASTYEECTNAHVSPITSDLRLKEKAKLDEFRRRVEAMIPKDKRFPIGNYKCYSCDANFKSLSNWEDHMVLYLNSKGCYPVESKSDYLSKREKALENIVEKDDFYECTLCSSVQCKTDIIQHFIKVHYKMSLKCAFCVKTCSSYHNLHGHLSYHHNPLRVKFKCPHCSLKFVDKNSLKTHINIIHDKVGWKCDICGRVCRDNANLRKHKLRVHSDSLIKDVHQCTDCNFTSSSKQSLKRHIICKHRTSVKYYCHYCKYSSLVKDYLVNHILLNHLKKPRIKKKYECDRCGVKLKTEVGLDYHVRSVHGKKIEVYICSHCSEQFRTKHDCFIHTNVEHLSAYEFQCNSCKCIATNKEDFIDHVNSQHAELHSASSPSTSASKLSSHINVIRNTDGDVIYKCPHCKYGAKTRSLFKQHMNVKHNPNAVIYKCYHCGHQNKIKHKLSQHMQTKHKDLLGKK